MLMNVNNNATSGISVPQPQRRSLILIPLGPAEEPPVFNLTLNLNGARSSFLMGIDEWVMKRPSNLQLVNRLVNSFKANLEMVPFTCDSLAKSSLVNHAKWLEEIFSMLLPIEDNDSSILHLACVRQQVRSNGRHVRLIILLTYIDEMLSSMLCSHGITKEVLTPCCKAYATLLCLVAALSPPRKLALELIQSTQQPSVPLPQVQLPQNQQVGFGASVAVTPVKMSESMLGLRVYQETFCCWSAATVQFEHIAIFYSSKEKPVALERHALQVRTRRTSDLIHQSFEYMMQQQPRPQPQQNTLQVPASLSLLTPTKPGSLSSVNSVSDITFEEDKESSSSDRLSSDTNSEESLSQEGEQQMNGKGEKQEVETSEVSAIWDSTPDDKATVDGTVHVATDGVDGRCASKKERIIMISAFLTGIEQESYVLRTESPSFLQSGTPTQVSAIHESQTCAPLSAENTSKEEEGKDGNEEVILTRDEIMEKTSDLVDTEITCAYSTCQVIPALSHSSASTRPLTLSVVLELPKDEGEEEENMADEVRMGSLENLASTSFELTTIGAFKLIDGSPIQIMLSGGSVIKHNQTLIEMQRYLLHEKASAFSASDTIKKYLENTGISKFTVQTLSNHEEEERRGSGETVKRSESQVRAASAMSPIESEVSTRRESRKTCTFRVSEGAPLMLKQLRQSQCKRRKIMWEKHRRYVREEAGSFLEGWYASTSSPFAYLNLIELELTLPLLCLSSRCRPIVLVDDEADCSAIVHMIGKTTESTVGYFSLRQDAPPPVTTICHSCFKRRQIVWSKYRRQLSEEAETFLTEKLTLRDDKQSMSLVNLPHLLPSLNASASVETIDIGPARILITSNRREDGGVVAHIVTEFPLNPVPSDNSKNLQFVFDVAMPEEPI